MSSMLDRLMSIDDRNKQGMRAPSMENAANARPYPVVDTRIKAQQIEQTVFTNRISAGYQPAKWTPGSRWSATHEIPAGRLAFRRFVSLLRAGHLFYVAMVLLIALSYVWFDSGIAHRQGRLAVAPASAVSAQQGAVMPVFQTETQIRQMVTQWVRAWSQRDARAYVSFYAADFIPSEGLRHTEWVAQRKARLNKYHSIVIVLSKMKIESSGGAHASVHFVQDFRGDNYQELGTNKELVLKNLQGRWLIAAEKVL